ncbi:MAG: ABC transporter permease subunit [Solirubrobacteraceae bacterium]|nr:ABC transporter permease subunit [Solirubrobacteraceae bacterium]
MSVATAVGESTDPTPDVPAATLAAGRRRGTTVLAPLLLVAVLIAAWQALADLRHIDPIVLPAPSDVATAAWDDRSLLFDGLLRTTSIVLAGIVIAAALGVLVGAALHRSPTARRAVEPLLVGSQAIPIPVLAPLLVIWLGFGLAPQLVLVVVVAFFPVAVATRDALASLDPETDLVLRNLGASGWQRVRLVELRGALPGIVTGLRLAVVFAVIGAVFADSTGSTATTAADPTSTGGLGRIVQDAIPQLATDRAFAAIVLLAALALVLFWSLGAAERRLDPTSPRSLRRTP